MDILTLGGILTAYFH